MSAPSLIISSSDKTRSGALPSWILQRIKGSLLNRGFVLVPSDTCYSVATLAIDTSIQTKINTILNRPKEPVSLCFPNIRKVEDYVYLNRISAALLEQFTPGPITVVCQSLPEIPTEITSQVLGSSTRTIGVRIPDSQIEREIASCTKYPITTAAVRDPKNNQAVKDFDQAMAIVTEGMSRLDKNIIWEAAIEGDNFYSNHSTVVHVDVENVNLIREGDILFQEIEAASKNTPFWSIEDWT